MKLRTMALATQYCVGAGVELGAASHNPFDLPDCLKVAPCDGRLFLYPQDMDDFNAYHHEQMRTSGEVESIDLLGDFQSIAAGDGTFDYLISSHVIEHVPNVFAAYIESSRVLKNGGVFFCIFPKRTATLYDSTRPLITVEQMVDDYEKGLDMAIMPKENWRGHYQVFSLQSMIRAINFLNKNELGSWLIECVEETDSKVGNGHTVVLRKFDGLISAVWQDGTAFSESFNQLVSEGKLADALRAIKVSLSFNFFDAEKLYLASLLSCELGYTHEGIEFLRQALTLDPENEGYRKDFLSLTNAPYVNTVL